MLLLELRRWMMRFPLLPALVSGLILIAAPGAHAQAAAHVCATPQIAFGGAAGTPATTTATMAVGHSVVIGDVYVEMQISHAWVSEIHLRLKSPAGTSLDLQANAGGAGGIDLIYADGGVPYASQAFDFGCHMRAAGGSFGVFSGENSQGSWTLQITDSAPGWNDGVLESWCLTFFTAPQTSLPSPVLSLVGEPTEDGVQLSWTNGAPYSGIDVIVNDKLDAQLPGTATSHVVTMQPAGFPVTVEVQPTTVGGLTACPVARTVIPFGPLPTPKTEKLVHIVVDGLRYSEGLGDPIHANVPRMAALAAQGTIIEPFLNDHVTLTNRAIPAIFCGSWDPPITFLEAACMKVNLYSARPTVHEYFRQQLDRPAADCQYITGPFSCPWRDSFHPSYGPSYWPQWVPTPGADNDVFAAAKAAIVNDQPSMLTVYLHDVDAAGHSNNWNNYIAAIQNADKIVGDLWDFLQAEPAYAGKTTMIVTNDHGRHWYDFKGHGDGCSGCRTIQFLAIGPSILSGHVSTVPRAIPDIAPTIGALLGFNTEYADGAVMTELFETCQTDIGFGGPGGVSLAVCGQTLESGNQATMSVTGGSPNATSLLVISLMSNPTPFLGGTLATYPVVASLPLSLDSAGEWSVTVDGGFGPLILYVQFAVEDLGQPQGAALSNALQLSIGQ